MKFECPHCGQHLSVGTVHLGMKANCPGCGQGITVPGKDGPGDETVGRIARVAAEEGMKAVDPAMPTPETPSDQIIQTLQSSVDRSERTISQFMQEQKMDGGVDLSDSEDGSTASKFLTAEQGRKYKLGHVVARGGMGAILDAKEHNLRRNVAMKVVLNPGQATKEHVLRFIEEAQVTAQLEHPSIVPVHELGVDTSGNVFYTMKMIRGVTLKKVLQSIKDGDEKTIQEYPLSRLCGDRLIVRPIFGKTR